MYDFCSSREPVSITEHIFHLPLHKDGRVNSKASLFQLI